MFESAALFQAPVYRDLVPDPLRDRRRERLRTGDAAVFSPDAVRLVRLRVLAAEDASFTRIHGLSILTKVVSWRGKATA